MAIHAGSEQSYVDFESTTYEEIELSEQVLKGMRTFIVPGAAGRCQGWTRNSVGAENLGSVMRPADIR